VKLMDCSTPLNPVIRSSAFTKKLTVFHSVFVCTFLILSQSALSVETVVDTQPQSLKKSSLPLFEYQLENRSDPFAPFITEKAAAASVNMDEIIDSTGPLTGMQLFEPGQLTLVALLRRGSEDLAMVEDFTGKGYVLTEGTKIGQRGIVKDIAPTSVIIEETAVTRAGKKIVSEVVMLLKKEGEE